MQGRGLGLTEEVRVRSPIHFHPTLDLCAFVYPAQGEEDGEGEKAILAGTDPLPCRGVQGADDGGSLKEEEVSLCWSFWSKHNAPVLVAGPKE